MDLIEISSSVNSVGSTFSFRSASVSQILFGLGGKSWRTLIRMFVPQIDLSLGLWLETHTYRGSCARAAAKYLSCCEIFTKCFKQCNFDGIKKQCYKETVLKNVVDVQCVNNQDVFCDGFVWDALAASTDAEFSRPYSSNTDMKSCHNSNASSSSAPFKAESASPDTLTQTHSCQFTARETESI